MQVSICEGNEIKYADYVHTFVEVIIQHDSCECSLHVLVVVILTQSHTTIALLTTRDLELFSAMLFWFLKQTYQF